MELRAPAGFTTSSSPGISVGLTSPPGVATTLARVAAEARERRRQAGLALVGQAGAVARACHAIARRLHHGGKLVAFGTGGGATDAQHIAVEFVHPVIVGKRALPAIALTSDTATLTGVAARAGWDEVFAHQLRYLACAQDIAVAVMADPGSRSVVRGLEVARAMGLLTVALVSEGVSATPGPTVDHALVAQAAEPAIVKEVQTTLYHIVWELVHVFLDQPGLLR